ncbi:MAG: hypothetical protein WC683_07005 [bacterium]
MYYVKYRSRFTGEPCVMIVTRTSTNRKTGNMVQVWFLKLRHAPHKVVKCKRDKAICGNCPLRGGCGCYVIVFKGPLSIWNALRRGSYRALWNHAAEARRLLGGRKIRLGAYGDPASAPVGVIRRLFAIVQPTGWTGYTHSWERAPWLRPYCMASVETAWGALRAWAKGWRTFRIRQPEDVQMAAAEMPCINESHGRQCIQCGLCNGSRDGVKSIVITAHGARKSLVVTQ